MNFVMNIAVTVVQTFMCLHMRLNIKKKTEFFFRFSADSVESPFYLEKEKKGEIWFPDSPCCKIAWYPWVVLMLPRNLTH